LRESTQGVRLLKVGLKTKRKVNKLKNKNKKNKMNTKIKLLIMASALLMTAQARATLDIYDISFITPTATTVAVGVVDVNIVNNLAVSGTMTVVNGVGAGTYTLIGITAPVGSQSTSPNGAFYYDNLVFGPPADPYVDNNGLLFGNTTSEINLYSTTSSPTLPPDNYNLWQGTGGGSYALEANGSAAIDFAGTAVPEPTTIISAALMLLPFGIGAVRSIRKDRTA
jgi:hypothetical protein